MAIGSVIQRGILLFVYDERGQQTGIIGLGVGDAMLQGYTATTVTVRRGTLMFTYDERGRMVAVISGQ